MEKKILYFLLGLAALSGAFFTGSTGTFGGALSGQAGVATSSTMTVGPQEVLTVFSYSRSCGNRTISTGPTAIMLSFKSSVVPSGIVGRTVAASSTVELDSNLYGCGDVTAYGYASTTITRTEFSQ